MRLLKLLTPVVLVVTMSSGIYRHDRPVERYMQLAAEPQFDGVGRLLRIENGKWENAGSFVLIDSLHILSVAHCFIGEKRKDTIVDYKGMKIQTYVVTGHYERPASDFRFSVQNLLLTAKSIVMHPDYMKNGSCDIVLITLDKPLSGQAVLTLNEIPDELGDTVTGVGYGVSGPANKPEHVMSYSTKLAGQNKIDSIGGVKAASIATVLFADFDQPDPKKKTNRLGSSKPLDLEYSTGGGDSGGPLFRFRKGNMQLIGLASYGDGSADEIKNGYYGKVMGWTRIAAFKDWIAANRK
ncbi:MAG: hypothetical protein K0S33_2876 [Bacteroidetes bacterium]|jgi:hypothetical protein|nr:hypothetical protein [Bacteroidota bacterium]